MEYLTVLGVYPNPDDNHPARSFENVWTYKKTKWVFSSKWSITTRIIYAILRLVRLGEQISDFLKEWLCENTF